MIRNGAQHFRKYLLLSAVLIAAAPVSAQPTGGPYGPIDQRYEVPKAAHVYFVAPDGKPEAAGSLAEPTTLASAIDRVVTGDAIVMRGGIYRTGGLQLNQGVTIQPYLEERPIVKGTEVATRWQRVAPNVWRTQWKTLFPASPLAWWNRASEGVRTPLHKFNNDMVFVDGELLKSAGWEGELDAHSFFIDYQAGYVYVGVDPANKLVEITAYDGAIIRTAANVHGKTNDKKGYVMRGITFTQYPFRALEVEGKKHFTSNDEPTDEPVGLSDPSTYGKEVTGTVLENVTITFCSRVAGYFRGDGLIIRNSLVSDTSTEGIYVIGSADVLLERNIVRRNNNEGITGYYPSAVKIFNQSHRTIVRDNLILDNPNSTGVWWDVGNHDAVFANNWVEGASNGLFFEISKGVTAVGNVFVNCDRGIYILNSADAKIYNNTFLNATASFERNTRVATGDRFGWHATTGPDIDKREGHIFVNNLMVASDAFQRPLLSLGEPAVLCTKLPTSMAKEINGNVYARRTPAVAPATPLTMISFGPYSNEACVARAASLDEFRKIAPTFEAGARQLDRTPASIFKSPDLNRLDLQQPMPAAQGAPALPADVRKILGWSEQDARTIGAYPARR